MSRLFDADRPVRLVRRLLLAEVLSPAGRPGTLAPLTPTVRLRHQSTRWAVRRIATGKRKDGAT